MVRLHQLKPTMLSASTINVTDINQRCIFIDDLRESGVYQVLVLCFNAACLGPFSDSVEFIVYDSVLQTPPTNVTAVAVNSTTIQVTFLPPRFTAERSDLYYVITARRAVVSSVSRRVERGLLSDSELSVKDSTEFVDTVTVRGRLLSSSVHSDVVTGLDKFTKYLVTLCCVTDSAAGPASSAVTVHTLDDGMSHLFILHSKQFGHISDRSSPIFVGMAMFWASTRGRMARYASC